MMAASRAAFPAFAQRAALPARRALVAARAAAEPKVAEEAASPAAAAAAPAPAAAPAAASTSTSGAAPSVRRPHPARATSPWADPLEVMAFNGTGPELINGRLAMLGFMAALGAELFLQKPVLSLWGASFGTVFKIQLLFIAASLVPLFRGYANDEAFGPFTPEAEKLNGRAAMAAEQSREAAPEDKRAGRATYRPSTYTELVQDAVTAVAAAVADGETRLEVEFPAVSNVDGYKGASDLYIDANIQLALAAARQLAERTGKRVHMLLPDEIEFKRAEDMFKSALATSEGVSMGHFREGRQTLLTSLFFSAGGTSGKVDLPAEAQRADIFLALNASTVELADLETYVNETVKERVVVTWNMELDTLRSDLGLLGFPPKDLQHRFLCLFKPVFYIRQRDYSKSVAVAPFIINYSGALFREYPGPWQVMLRQDNGVYACVAEDAARRYNLGEFKEELMMAMGLNTEGEGSAMAFLRRGYKTSTWWEDDEDKEESKAWRS
ncbi:LOW PSII ACCUMULATION chloroplastic [Micractinium conductrix]|uniref:LOW PSII ACCUMULATION chloroplastic n=1 Tax=Micractinium conductrix TaxID=554055 RepID=A0A2P6VLG5_9CHLO|nr:LOW PSII ACCUMULATION chloroplastic [Micractinium conductrix]|eukprot:PSC74905.1 LOW PSII ACCUMULATION chloroplastic [Micractinium conductrix]